MQKAVFLLMVFLAGTVVAQTPLNQQVISSQPGAPVPGAINGPGSLMVTNPAGGTFSLSELDAQLTTLKADIERTLPLVVAVTSQSPSSTPSRSQEIANVASNLLSRAFGGSTNQNGALPPSGTSPRMTNFAGFLRGLVSTNTGGGGGVSFDPNTLNQLATLQNQLRPVLSTLDGLNIPSVGGGTNQPFGNFNNRPNGIFAPTGR
jgi:hypothetical protein